MPRAATAPDLPLYPSEDEIARAVLGSDAKAWPSLAAVWEREGLPKRDIQTGRRFWPAVLAWFCARSGLDQQPGIQRTIRVLPFATDARDAPQTEPAPAWGGDRRARRSRP